MLRAFSHNELELQTIVKGDELFFKGKDVCDALGYERSRNAIERHVSPEYKKTLSEIKWALKRGALVNEQPHAIFVTEPGLYELIFSSKLPVAVEFRKWVFEEVLPTIRKTGTYSIFNGKNQLVFKIENEDDLHNKVVNYIHRFYPDVILIAGLGELQDTSSKRKMTIKGVFSKYLITMHTSYIFFCVLDENVITVTTVFAIHIYYSSGLNIGIIFSLPHINKVIIALYLSVVLSSSTSDSSSSNLSRVRILSSRISFNVSRSVRPGSSGVSIYIMNKDHIPFNALIVGPTGCGKTQFIVEQLLGPFRYQFDYIVLLCPTYVRNKTWDGIGIKDGDFYVDILDPNNLSAHLKFWHGTFLKQPGDRDNTQVLLILDDIACGDDVKKRTSELIKLAFSGRHDNVSVWLLSQQLTSVSKPYRENIGALVVFYTPCKADLETILSDYGGEITKDELKLYMRQLKKHQHSKMIFSLRYPYSVSLLT